MIAVVMAMKRRRIADPEMCIGMNYRDSLISGPAIGWVYAG